MTTHTKDLSAPSSVADSTIPTPILSPSGSADPSPAFATVLQTPDGSDVEDFDFSLGEAAQAQAVSKDSDIPECWGHRGASATYPENTRASFIKACQDGADGIETDIHITSDNRLVMFHDPELSRTTDGEGRIDKLPWTNVLEHIRTTKAPHQPIPLFTEVLDILMMPENAHVKLNIDCKVENDPVRLFGLIKAAVEGYPGWATKLAPRIILGLWHPRYLEPASEILPYLPRFAISMSIAELRSYWYDHCHGFSVMYEALASAEGIQFRKDCKATGKDICSWTVNSKEEMRRCARWGIRSIISDKPDQWRDIKQQDRATALKPTLAEYILPYLRPKNYSISYEETEYLEREAGKFSSVIVPASTLRIAKPGDAFL